MMKTIGAFVLVEMFRMMILLNGVVYVVSKCPSLRKMEVADGRELQPISCSISTIQAIK
jgi:hypothetical protein